MQSLVFHYKTLKRAIKILFQIEKVYILLTILTATISAITPFIPIYFSARVLDELYIAYQLLKSGQWQEQNLAVLVYYIALTVGLTFILNFVNSVLKRLKDLRENQFYKNEQMMFAKKAMEMNYERLEDREISTLQAQIARNSQMGQNTWMLRNSISEIIMNMTTVMTSGVFMSCLFSGDVIEDYYKILLIVIMGGIIFIGFFCTARKNRLFNDMVNQWEPLNLWWSYYNGFFSSYHIGKDIRIFNLAQMIEEKYKEMNTTYQKLDKETNSKQTSYIILNDIAMFMLQMLTYLYVIYVCIKGSISVGEITANVAYILMFVNSINTLIAMVQNLLNNNQYLEQYYKYLDLPTNRYIGTRRIDMGDKEKYEIEFKNVFFRYPSSNQFVLKNINIKIVPSEKIAVVGLNGSGKTTFIKLLCRLYEPTEGEILLNGVNIREIEYKDYLKLFSAVYQDFKLFSFTLGQNIATNNTYDPCKVTDNLKKVGLAKKVDSMVDSLDTYLYKEFDENGHELSGGEAQKIAMARALYKDSPFIVLDEPTSALDPIAEAELYTNFDSIISNKTAIYISHRLASCKFCDRIMVFCDGQIIQEGNHDTLLRANEGMYAEMWKSQAQYYL